jgi:hypothetical protein
MGLSVLLCTTFAHATTRDDTYIAGYAAGVLKQNLQLKIPALTVRDGVITLPVGDLSEANKSAAVQLLSEIEGVSAVKTVDANNEQFMINSAAINNDATVLAAESTLSPTGLLPKGHLFKPLIADTRWAHFSASYRNYQTNNFDNGKNIGSVSFGETIPFYRNNFGNSIAQWEIGLQGGVFSDFNLDAPSSDLVNTDFIASVYSSFRAGHFSAFGRLFHQSSHLGDEFLLRQVNNGFLDTKFKRVNLSYEGADLKMSYELPFGVRLYGGGGGIFDKEPSTLKVWMTQYGIEFRSPWRIDFASMRPVIAADFKNFQENNWSTDISARAGFEFENFQILGRKLQILAEYYKGYSPSGQFYKSKVEYIGVGLHYHF